MDIQQKKGGEAMKTKLNQLMSLLLIVAVILGFTACANDDPHEGEGGVAIALDNSRCPNVTIGNTYLYIYDTGGNLCAFYDYADARAVAFALLPLEAGHYTVAVVINADAAPTETATLTALHEWVAAQAGIDSDLISGIAEADVVDNRVVRFVIPLYQESFSLPVLSVRFTLPETGMADFTPGQTRNRAASFGYTLRCVAELCKAGTDQVVLHKVVTPALQEDGTYRFGLQVSEGDYDLRLWADYAHTDAPLADAFYHTESLKAVTLFTEPYTANTDAKDVAYGNERGITMSGEGATVTMAMLRPLAKFRLIVDADEVKEYLNIRKYNPQEFPPIEQLTVSVRYEGYFPSGFNVSTGKPNDATGGIAFSGSLAHFSGSATELELCSDWIFVNGTSSFVNATVIVSDNQGNMICRVPGTQIDYRRNQLTTVKGRFLTSGTNSGGICIDTKWDGVYDVWF